MISRLAAYRNFQPACHSERSGAKRNAVEESRGQTVHLTPRDPSTPLRYAQDDRKESAS